MGDTIVSSYKIQDAEYKKQDSKIKLYLATCYLCLATLLLVTGCAISYGVYHKIEKGQTLWRIAKTYNVDIQDVAEFNDITDITQIKEGQKLFIPGAWQVLKVEPYQLQDSSLSQQVLSREPNTQDSKHQTPDPKYQNSHPKEESGNEKLRHEPEGKIVVEKWRFVWPVKGEVLSLFGVRNGKKHDGIDIAAPTGSPVFAAADGEVIYSDDGVRGYGNMVMLKHKDGFVTIYAHNRENLVKDGEAVKRGTIIARLGNSGHSSGPHLHFEVIKDKKPRNPLFFLP
ncbi:MAG TPA: M23 family metallopeptidase [Thermodesulfobacteriota bacterium]|nr:M23 family metallopeptidase [Thermodesulfobacteriota bacterium]